MEAFLTYLATYVVESNFFRTPRHFTESTPPVHVLNMQQGLLGALPSLKALWGGGGVSLCISGAVPCGSHNSRVCKINVCTS